jgi:hypothetical protein
VENTFWQAKVIIRKVSKDDDVHEENLNSWLYDFFYDFTIYGVEVIMDIDFTFSFFINADTRFNAIKKGQTLLMLLIQRYKGLVGEIEIQKIDSQELEREISFYEMVLPRLPEGKIDLFHRIIDLFDYKGSHTIKSV